MALVNAYGVFMGAGPYVGAPPGFTSTLIDLTGEKMAWVGQVNLPNNGLTTKDVQRVAFRFGAITKAGGSALTVSLQDVDGTTGSPMRPDETQDQTVAISNANIPAANTWYRTGTLSTNRTVSHGQMLAVVVEFDGAGRLGSDLINFTNLADPVANPTTPHLAGAIGKISGTWTRQSVLQNIILEMSDGTFGTLGSTGLGYTMISSATGSSAINTGSTPDEVALKFQVPFECLCDGLCGLLNLGASADFDMVLYEGTTAIATRSVDATQIVTSGARPIWGFWAAQSIKPNVDYYATIKPTTANSVTLYYNDVADANHLSVMPGGTLTHYASRTDAGAWTPLTTRRPLLGVSLAGFHDRGVGPLAQLGF
jgi:hypothetical protein